jgi:hypothetical protein
VRAGGQAHPPHGHLQRTLPRLVERTDLSQLANGDAGVIKATRLLNGSGALNTCADFSRTHPVTLAAQLLKRHRWHFNVQVDAVEQRPANLAQIPLDDPARTAAFACRIGKMTARTSVQISIERNLKLEGRPDQQTPGPLAYWQSQARERAGLNGRGFEGRSLREAHGGEPNTAEEHAGNT